MIIDIASLEPVLDEEFTAHAEVARKVLPRLVHERNAAEAAQQMAANEREIEQWISKPITHCVFCGDLATGRFCTRCARDLKRMNGASL